MFERLGSFVVGHRRGIALIWVAIFVLGIVFGGQAFGRLKSDIDSGSNSESVRADELLSANGSHAVDLAAVVDRVDVRARETRSAVGGAVRDVEALDGVAGVASYYSTGSEDLVATDGRATAVVVTLERGLGEERWDQALHDARSRLEAIDVGKVLVTGPDLLDEEAGHQAEADLQRGELLSLPVVMVVLLLLFGGIVGAGLPIVVALFSVAGALLMLLGITYVTDVSVYSVNVVTMLGLGLAIDYSLLLINRFRDERASGSNVVAAVATATATAGRTVAFSGVTVAVALCGLLFFHDPTLRSMGLGGIGVVLLSAAASVTLLPALIAMWGHRIKVPKTGQLHEGFFFRLSRFVQKRAVVIVVITGLALVSFATPFLDANYGWSGVEALPRTSEARQVAELWESRFESGGSDPITAALPNPTHKQLETFVTYADALDGVARTAVEDLDGVVSVQMFLDVPTHSSAAKQLVVALRGFDAGTSVLVGGETAGLIDYQREVTERLPLAVGTMLGATFLLLFLMTGSVVVPLKAIVMNMLSLTASFGILIWGFQDGHLSGLLNFDATSGVIDIFVPILVFVFAFGLSMDYEVFLLSRIKEEYDRSGNNDSAVAVGLQRTGRTVTSAAVLIVAVFAGFAAGGFTPIKAMGVGMATAVILDATIVRMLLVPATMKLMGDRNWWAPQPLKRMHERYGLSESAPSAAHA